MGGPISFQIRPADWRAFLRSTRRYDARPQSTPNYVGWNRRIHRLDENLSRFNRRLRPLGIVLRVFAILFASTLAIALLAVTGFASPLAWSILGVVVSSILAILFPIVQLYGRHRTLWLPQVDASWDETGLYRVTHTARSWVAWGVFKGAHVEGDTLLMVTDYRRGGGVVNAVMVPLSALDGAQQDDIRARIEQQSSTPAAPATTPAS